jgi:hypothetical protein
MAVALPFIGLAMTAASTGFSIFAQSKQAKAQKQESEAKQAQAKRNAEAAKMAAKWARQSGDYEVNLIQQRADQLVGRARANIGAAGLDMGIGVGHRPMEDLRWLSAQDKNITRVATAQRVLGYLKAGENFNIQAAVEGQRQSSLLTNSLLTMTGTALSGAASMMKMWPYGPDTTNQWGLSYAPTQGYGQWGGPMPVFGPSEPP